MVHAHLCFHQGPETSQLWIREQSTYQGQNEVAVSHIWWTTGWGATTVSLLARNSYFQQAVSWHFIMLDSPVAISPHFRLSVLNILAQLPQPINVKENHQHPLRCAPNVLSSVLEAKGSSTANTADWSLGCSHRHNSDRWCWSWTWGLGHFVCVDRDSLRLWQDVDSTQKSRHCRCTCTKLSEIHETQMIKCSNLVLTQDCCCSHLLCAHYRSAGTVLDISDHTS